MWVVHGGTTILDVTQLYDTWVRVLNPQSVQRTPLVQYVCLRKETGSNKWIVYGRV